MNNSPDFWIIGMAITGSICLYPRGGIKYIDALFLASGAATQSGLNTVDINLLDTWQQIVLFFVPMLTNPITINSFVVFLRLYWFEKRFQHIAREATRNRRSMAKTFSKSKTTERDVGDEERGVNGRNITVMHGDTGPNGTKNQDFATQDQVDKERTLARGHARSSQSSQETSKGQSSDNGVDEKLDTVEDELRPQIKFADQVKRSNGLADQPIRMPEQRSNEDHIAFLQRQRDQEQDDGEALRIPGPRDADAGVAPVTVDKNDPLSQIMSRRESGTDNHSMGQVASRRDTDDAETNPNPPRRGITIAEPVKSPIPEHLVDDAVAAKATLGVLRLRKPRIFGEKTDEDRTPHARRTATMQTLQTLKSALSRDRDETMPYLSWEPTVGRNSAFVDLTEEQREELGGIEYRSLKSLALILTLYFIGFSLFGLISLVPWILENASYGDIVKADGQNRVWWGIFTANSAFTDLGYTLTPDSMISFQRAQWILVVMSFLIIIGNTGFPIMLRIIIWVTAQWVPRDSGVWEELKFLLDHPRRCFTLLFPSKATWWLFWILVILNGLDLLFFIILDVSLTSYQAWIF